MQPIKDKRWDMADGGWRMADWKCIGWALSAILLLVSIPAHAQEPKPADAQQTLELTNDPISYEVLNDGTIILKGNEKDVAALEALIQQFDQEIERPIIQFVQLENAPAKDLASKLQQLFQAVITSTRPQDKVNIIADEGSNSLMIAAPAAMMDEIIATAKDLDKQPRIPKFEVTILPLNFISAAEAAEKLKEALSEFQKKMGTGKAAEQISIVPSDRSNALMVSAPPEDIEQIKTLLKVLDVEPSGLAKAQLLFIPLLNARAEDLAKSLSGMFSAQGDQAQKLKETILRLRLTKVSPTGQKTDLPELDLEKPIRIAAEAGTNSLIIATHDQNVEPITEVVKLLDSVPMAPEMGVEFYPLKYADAESVSKTLKEMFDAGKKLPKVPEKEIKGAVPEGIPGRAFVYEVGIHADTRTNTLVVSGRPEQLAIAHTVVNQLDVEGSFFFPKPKLFYLEHSDAQRIADVLAKLNEQTVKGLEGRKAGVAAVEKERALIIPDLRANALIISATDAKFTELTELAQKLDSSPAQFLNEIRIINCNQTNAADLEKKIVELWKRKAELRKREEMPEDMPVIIADQRSNALVIASNVEDYEAIKKLVEDLEAQPLAPLAMIRMIEVKNNDAGQLGEMLKTIFDERRKQRPTSSGQENPADQVAITSDAATNMMLIASSPENFAEIQRIVEKLDVFPELEGVVQTFILRNADAAKVSEKIKELIDQGLYKPGSLGTESNVSKEREKIAMVSDARSNAIMVSASKPNMAIVQQLIEQMDGDAHSLMADTAIFKLSFVNAQKATEVLEQFFEGLKQSSTDQDVFVAPTVIPVESSNAIIVAGSRDGINRAQELLAKIDNQPTREMMFEVIQLKQAIADKLSETVIKALSGESTGDQNADEAASAIILSFYEDLADGQRELRKLIRQDISITPYTQTNSLLVVAPPSSMEMLRTLIRRLDGIPPITAEVEVYKLANASAEQMIETLQTIFEAEASGSSGSSEGPSLVLAEAGGAVAGLSAGMGLTFAADQRTNSVIVAGNREYLQLVGKLIAKLDGESEDQRVNFVHQAANSKAEDLAKAIQDFNKQENERLSGLEESTSAFHKAEQAITVVPDTESNSVVLGMSPRFRDQYMQIVNELDRAPNQVLIEVMFVEVTLDDRFELGIEFAAQDLLFSEHAVTGANGTVLGPNFDFTAGTDLGAAGSGQGFSFTMTGEDFNFLIHALQADGRAELISRPSILVKDNVEGNISIVAEVPIPTQVTQTAAGQPQTNVEYQDAGIELKVTPHINPDGFVQLEVNPRVSSVGASVAVGNITAPTFSTTELNTTITIKDGETAIIGGLIETNMSETESKIPFFGDIPVVGQAFRTNLDSQRRKELLIVITATVVRTPEDSFKQSVKQRDRGEIIPDNIKESPLMDKLRVQPGEMEMQFQDKPMLNPRRQEDEAESYGPPTGVYGPPVNRKAQRASYEIKGSS